MLLQEVKELWSALSDEDKAPYEAKASAPPKEKKEKPAGAAKPAAEEEAAKEPKEQTEKGPKSAYVRAHAGGIVSHATHSSRCAGLFAGTTWERCLTPPAHVFVLSSADPLLRRGPPPGDGRESGHGLRRSGEGARIQELPSSPLTSKVGTALLSPPRVVLLLAHACCWLLRMSKSPHCIASVLHFSAADARTSVPAPPTVSRLCLCP